MLPRSLLVRLLLVSLAFSSVCLQLAAASSDDFEVEFDDEEAVSPALMNFHLSEEYMPQKSMMDAIVLWILRNPKDVRCTRNSSDCRTHARRGGRQRWDNAT